MHLQSDELSTDLLRLPVNEILKQKKKKKIENQTEKFTSIVSGLNIYNCKQHFSSDTHSSVVAAWNADLVDASSNLFSFYTFFFIPNLKAAGLNPGTVKL